MAHFSEIHQTTVTEFLSGVIIIDDNIEFEKSYADVDNMQTETPKKDGPYTGKSQGEVEKEAPNPANIIKDTLYAREIIEDFSEAGIHCVTKKWGDENTGQALPKLTEKSDIVVVDWQMGDTGQEATRIISKLLQNNEKEIKYIVIYTAAPDVAIDSIKAKKFPGLAQQFEYHNQENVIAEAVVADEVVAEAVAAEEVVAEAVAAEEVVAEAVAAEEKSKRIGVFDFVVDGQANIAHRIEIIKKNGDQSNLCQLIIEGFSEFSEGFLRNVALNSLISLRKNTFKLLSLYPKELDLAAISHFTNLQSNKKEFGHAELLFRDYIGTLISDNLKDIVLYSNGTKKSLCIETISKYLENQSKLYSFITAEKFKNFSIENILSANDIEAKKKIIEEIEFIEKISVDNKNPQLAKIRKGFIEDNEDNLKSFSISDCTRNREVFSNEPKFNYPLKFGVIIKGPNSEEAADKTSCSYFLCLQPLCDSVRLSGPTDFIFVKLSLNEDDVNFIIRDRTDLISLNSNNMPHKVLKLIEFESEIEFGDIRTSDKKMFTAKNGIQYTWITELKDSYAQTVSHTLFSSGTRVGMDKFEWLRNKSN